MNPAATATSGTTWAICHMAIANRPIAHWVGGFGYGGQRLFVFPQLDIAVAITAGNYADTNQWIPPINVICEVVLPSVL